MNADTSKELAARLSKLTELCPDMRFGQMLATLAMLAEDMTDRSLWEIEDADLIGVVERFREDLTRRQQSVA